MKRSRLLSTITLTSLLSALLFTGCGNGGNSSEQKNNKSSNSSISVETESKNTDETVTIKIIDSNTFDFARQKGFLDQYFDGYNVDIQLSEMQGGPIANEAFAAGEADFCVMGNMPGIAGSANDYGIKIIGVSWATEYGAAIVVPIDSDIETIEDLKGRNIGTFIGGSWHYLTALYLESVGLSFDDVGLMNTMAETATAIRAGELDAGVIAVENAMALVEEGSARIIEKKSIEPGIYTISASEKFITEHPDLTKAYLRALKGTFEYINEHPDEYFSYYEEKTGSNADSVKNAWDLTERTARSFKDSELQAEKNLSDWMKEQGFIDDNFNIEDSIDDSLAREVEAENKE